MQPTADKINFGHPWKQIRWYGGRAWKHGPAHGVCAIKVRARGSAIADELMDFARDTACWCSWSWIRSGNMPTRLRLITTNTWRLILLVILENSLALTYPVRINGDLLTHRIHCNTCAEDKLQPVASRFSSNWFSLRGANYNIRNGGFYSATSWWPPGTPICLFLLLPVPIHRSHYTGVPLARCGARPIHRL